MRTWNHFPSLIISSLQKRNSFFPLKLQNQKGPLMSSFLLNAAVPNHCKRWEATMYPQGALHTRPSPGHLQDLRGFTFLTVRTLTRAKKENKSRSDLQQVILLYLFTPLIKVMRNKTCCSVGRSLESFSPGKLFGCAIVVCHPNEGGQQGGNPLTVINF